MKTVSVRTAVRTVELSQPLMALANLQDYGAVRVFFTLNGRLLGHTEIDNQNQSVSASELRQTVVNSVILKLFSESGFIDDGTLSTKAMAAINQQFSRNATEPIKLPNDVSASIVIATLDRPDELRGCLKSLMAQETSRKVEIVIIDNNPSSGLTPPVVAEYPEVVLVNESRRGLAYARNAGFIASKGDICVATDDDVRFPVDWLENLLAPFSRNDVMAVTGNVLPGELKSSAQQMFEVYGGLGRGYERKEINADWFEYYGPGGVPTWDIGATANAAFRSTIFNHPEIGLMNEALGPGMPSGVGEDTYLFYKILKAGYTIIYEPEAYVWHFHRREMEALRKQLFNYSKGHVAYHLATLIHDHDLRALVRLGWELPLGQFGRLLYAFWGRSKYPLSLILHEIKGNLAGPWAFWKSCQRVKQEGRSKPYIPVLQRSITSPDNDSIS